MNMLSCLAAEISQLTGCINLRSEEMENINSMIIRYPPTKKDKLSFRLP